MKFLGVLNNASGTAQGLGVESTGDVVKGATVQWLYGSGAPDNGGGKDNDMYLQDNGNVWKKAAGVWVYTGINLTGGSPDAFFDGGAAATTYSPSNRNLDGGGASG